MQVPAKERKVHRVGGQNKQQKHYQGIYCRAVVNVPLIVRCLLSLLLQINPNINIYNSSPGLVSFSLSQIVRFFCSL